MMMYNIIKTIHPTTDDENENDDDDDDDNNDYHFCND